MQKRQGFLTGFTLVEMLVVVFVISILAAIGIPQYAKVVEKGKMREAESNLLTLYMGQKMYKLDHPAVGYIGCNDLTECGNNSHIDMDLIQKYFNYSCGAYPATGPPYTSFDCTAERNSGRYETTTGAACNIGCRMAITSYAFEFQDSGGCIIQAGTDYQAGEVGLCSGCP